MNSKKLRGRANGNGRTGGILFREYCFRRENSLSSAANSVSSARNSVSSHLHTNNRLKGTHWVRSPELSEPQKTHWARCLKPYSPKPYSARFRVTEIRWRSPICGFLRESAVFCGFLRPPNAWISRRRGESAKISVRKSAIWAPSESVTLVPSP